jgi:hypothetical protein
MTRTIVDRFGWPKVLGCALLVGCLAGFIKMEIGHNDGPPSCAMAYVHHSADEPTGAYERNKIVDCMDAIEKWCAKNHPEDPDTCSQDIEIDGDDRNVGKG